MQPTHCALYSRADHSYNWSLSLGTERANRAWRTRDLRDAGAVVALGSDWPIAPFDPRGVIAAGQIRRAACRPDVEPVQPAQARWKLHESILAVGRRKGGVLEGGAPRRFDGSWRQPADHGPGRVRHGSGGPHDG